MRDALTWLDHASFRLAASTGGRHEGFGNALLYYRGPADVEVVRDRGQWDIAVRPGSDSRYYSLAVLLAARDGTDWEPPGTDGPDLPAQLPPGVL